VPSNRVHTAPVIRISHPSNLPVRQKFVAGATNELAFLDRHRSALTASPNWRTRRAKGFAAAIESDDASG
jgi:hypothetical protein